MKFPGADGDRERFIFPVQLTTSRIGNLTRLVHTLLYVMTISYIHKTPAPCLKKNLNACGQSESGGKISKRLGGIIGCKDETSS